MPKYCLYFPLIEFDYYSSIVKNQDYESEILIFFVTFPFFLFCLQEEPIKLSQDEYACPFCQFTTKRKDVMKRHICTHTGKKPYKCSFCSYSAVQNSDLKSHFKRRHGEYYDIILARK